MNIDGSKKQPCQGLQKVIYNSESKKEIVLV